jgi:hypothetical protein
VGGERQTQDSSLGFERARCLPKRPDELCRVLDGVVLGDVGGDTCVRQPAVVVGLGRAARQFLTRPLRPESRRARRRNPTYGRNMAEKQPLIMVGDLEGSTDEELDQLAKEMYDAMLANIERLEQSPPPKD